MNETLSLSQIFYKKIFRIPDYQRGYAWQNQQLSDFWDDLVNLSINRKHYTGLLSWKKASISEVSKLEQNEQYFIHNGYQLYFIIDGQQRLTTFLILLKSLIDVVCSQENSQENDISLGLDKISQIKEQYICKSNNELSYIYMFGYEKDNPNSQYLNSEIFGENNHGSIENSFYTRNLLNAKLFFREKINEYYNNNGIKGIEQLYGKLTNNFIFYIQEIQDDYDVCVAFETMNNRGKPLTNLELLKNRLIYLTTLYDDAIFSEDPQGERDKLRRNINSAWKEIYHQLGRKENNLLSDNEFLRSHWITYFTYSRKKGNDYINFLLNKFSYKSIYGTVTNCNDISEISENIYPERDDSNNDDTYDTENNSDIITEKSDALTPKEINDYVTSLEKYAPYWFYTFFPEDAPHINKDEKDWIRRLNNIGINYFRPLVAVSLMTKNISQEDRLNFYKAIERFIFITRMAQYFSNYKSSEFYNDTKKLYNKEITLSNITEKLIKYANNDLPDAITRFQSKINKLFEEDKGFFSWNNLKYFLYEYEESLIIEQDRKITWDILQSKDTIEHILPQDPSEEYWQTQFSQYSDREIKYLQSSLGNFLPLSRSANSKLQNFAYPQKRQDRYIKGSYSEIEVSNDYPKNWTAESIYKRGLKLLNFLSSRWELDLNDEIKEKLLHIEFIHSNKNN